MELILEMVPIPAMVSAPIMVPAPAWNRLQLRLFESNSDSDSGIGNYRNHNSSSVHRCLKITFLVRKPNLALQESQPILVLLLAVSSLVLLPQPVLLQKQGEMS